MRYVNARYRQYQREMAYRFYISDGMKMLTANTANAEEGMGYFTEKFCDILKPVETETRTGEEIAKYIINKAGIEVIE